jgi:hypothetical protein
MSNVAHHVIDKAGGHRIVADWCDVSLATVYRWTWEKARGGTGGIIPARYQPVILDKGRGKLEPQDFFPKDGGNA